MIELSEPRRIGGWFRPERPGPLIGPHVLQTGRGRILVDDPAAPRTVLAQTGGDNFDLSGDPRGLGPQRLPDGLYRADEAFEPVLREQAGEVVRWPRVIYELDGEPRPVPVPAAEIRPLGPHDAAALEELSPPIRWISESWDGPFGAAACGLAVGAFADGRLVSVALPFYVGERYEDIGVVTEQGHRGRGLSAACAARVVQGVLGRGRRPSWSTGPDNRASRRVAVKLGFRFVRDDLLYSIGSVTP